MTKSKQEKIYHYITPIVLWISLLLVNNVFAASGDLKWTFDTNEPISSSPAIGPNGTIFVTSDNGKLYALSPQGVQKWLFDTGSPRKETYQGNDVLMPSPTIAADGTIYVMSTDGILYAINQNGTKKWEFYTAQSIPHYSPVIGSDATIYIGSGYDLFAINPDGHEKWRRGVRYARSSPVIDSEGTIYIHSFGNALYAFDSNGNKKWHFNTSTNVASSPAIGSDGSIYLFGHYLFALNQDGTLKWKKSYTPDRSLSSPAIGTDGMIYMGAGYRGLKAINADGSTKWTFNTNGKEYSSPAVDLNNTIYIGSTDNNFYAVNPNGTKKWTYNTQGEIWSSPVIGSDGTVYVGSNDGKLYALEGDASGPAESAWPMYLHDSRHTGQMINENPMIGKSCGNGMVYDCSMNCVNEITALNWIGDTYCDDGTWGIVLTCPAFENDGGDCETTPKSGNACGNGLVYDCALTCVNAATAQSWTGDGVCDDGTWGFVLTCPAFNNDGVDCN